ncbi:MAG: FAD-binding oxidoreductase [Pseudomonadales bacterium]|nr:FAD-binding oxidoreductase [Pseudomonadales bacterium]MBI25520.1 FAD-binding oxidoreductase [Pseudomonadales bacterium]HAG92679.1 FAD-binding oxidoreductase [Gammaproteobacteria bacterium]HAU16087.1 FAD-binding oxidoreductase [Gammaproteobacteria bacterium]HBO95500.1 FAD-binding oxidoreductase [Gammaproteobacteria bacterium]|tara:strand:+ start:1602 stop:2999 length:1398 start_codon:yes stop_codon:yes gene_type:complete
MPETPANTVPHLVPDLHTQLSQLLGPRLSCNRDICRQHGHGESHHPPAPPAAVAFVESEAELIRVVRLCHQHHTPMVAFGAGTSVEGQLQCLEGGLCIDFSPMNRILAINAADQNCVVEPGVTREQLNHQLRHQGLFFPVDPGANASLGGMVATGASGTTTLRYGSMKHNVLSLRAVLANGECITTGSGARKSSAGYNLGDLLVGSEGTLALISAIQLKLYAIPEQVTAARVQFDSVQQAVNAVISMIQHNVPVARLELLDAGSLRAVNRYCRTHYPEQPTLFIEFHGTANALGEQVDTANTLCRAQAGFDFVWTEREEEKKQMWHARHNAYYAALAQVPDGKGWVTDVCVPLSALAECIEATQADLAGEQLDIPIVGHVGDGNFHLLFSIPPQDDRLLQKAQRINQRLIQRAHQLGGTCTGEHGIGLGKKDYLLQEKGAAGIAVMQAIKQALDPLHLLNPGKIF